MRRVVVIGTTGSGKSRLAERLAEQTGLRVIELDALFWGRDWQPAPVTGSPLLPNVAAWIDCDVERQMEAGDPSVSLDLLIRALLVLVASNRDVGKLISSAMVA